MTSDCETIELRGPLDKIRIAISSDGGLNGIRYYRGRRGKTYGSVRRGYTDTRFSEDKPVVGLYGSHNGSRIEQLGFLTLDTECQAARL